MIEPKAEKLICKICNQGELIKTQIHHLSPPLVFLGYIILIPSLVVLAIFAFTTLIIGVSGGTEGLIGALIILIPSSLAFFFPILIGYLLTLKKTVLKCQKCTATITAN